MWPFTRPSPVLKQALRPARSGLLDSPGWVTGPFGGFPSYTGVGGGPVTTTYGTIPAEPIGDDFVGLVRGALKCSGLIGGLTRIRCSIFSEVRPLYQHLRSGRPTDLWGDQSLAALEHPWQGGTCGDLLFRAQQYADMAGNAYITFLDGEFVLLRPDWVDILLARRMEPRGPGGKDVQVGWKKLGYAYSEGGGRFGDGAAIFLPDEVCHYAPLVDPEATYRGMSWVTPVIRDLEGDQLSTKYKAKYFENAGTPNLAVSMAKEISPENFERFVDIMESKHAGIDNAFKTLYLAGGADVTLVGSNLKDLDTKAVSGKAETRVAFAAGVHPVVAGLAEGLEGSSLNVGNFSAARRIFADCTMSPLWRNFCGSMEVLVPPPPGSRLWYDGRDVPFLQEDQAAAAEIQTQEAAVIRTLLEAGCDFDSVIQAIKSGDWSALTHSGLLSVQLQPPGTVTGPAVNSLNLLNGVH